LGEPTVSVAVIGASGYTGGELTRLLLDHPHVRLSFLSAERHAGAAAGAVHPALRNHPAAAGLRFQPLEQLEEVDIAIACLPTGALPPLLPPLLERARRVLNVAGDFRLRDPRELEAHYPATGKAPPPLPFAYFVPELSGPPPEERLVSLPGCMAVATLYALFPLFAGRLVEPLVVADAKTGASGGGRGPSDHPAERSGNFRVHRLHGHRHQPEIRQALQELTQMEPDLQFSTHSLDTARGIMVTTYTSLLPEVEPLDVKRAYARAYVGKPFVRVRPAPKSPQDFPMLKSVVGSNVAEIGVTVRNGRCVAVAALDNLIKGAAGQAIQAMNLVSGMDEALGLPYTAVAP
jgi:N-acetyl-gamma-glutamyl-phosphate/LysW-gamma-L-alpha-aminoadipyl-6-phosphate reductase